MFILDCENQINWQEQTITRLGEIVMRLRNYRKQGYVRSGWEKPQINEWNTNSDNSL